MGVLQKNESKNEDMTDICKFLHKYVPGHNPEVDTRPVKILSGGDYLTFERHKQSQVSVSDDETPSLKLEGLVPKMEEFHNQAEVIKVCNRFNCAIMIIIIMSTPWKGYETYCFSPLRPSVCPSIHLSVRHKIVSALYLDNRLRYFSKISYICKVHWDNVSCTRTITLLWIFIELFLFDNLEGYHARSI